jgi:hypothetical protein
MHEKISAKNYQIQQPSLYLPIGLLPSLKEMIKN